MGLRLSVQRAAWLARVAGIAARTPGLVPVVKGNGYGFGRTTVMPIAAEHAGRDSQIAVGTVYEACDVPAGRVAVVLTPHLDRLPADLPTSAVLTVAGATHVEALHDHGWRGRVTVKLRSSMHRYGTLPEQAPALMAALHDAGFAVDGYAIHLPLAGNDSARVDEIVDWLPYLDPSLPVSVSHLAPETYARLCAIHPAFEWRMRLGSALWHGDKALLQLSADVLEIHPVAAGSTAGYRATHVTADGHLVLVAAGSAHGICALDDGRSPFHFARHRLTMLEPPHMHTTMLLVPLGDPLPEIRERVDVQRPLIATTVDELEWLGA